MKKEELLKKIAMTAGIAGMDMYKNLNIHSFIEWYKKNTSFNSERGKTIAQEVIDFLSK